tara:strand:- start:301 stop:801 length:501 start_codon:yes stop_codon:yes gene_type:complete
MSDDLINLQKKRISKLEEQLKEETSKLQQLESYKDNDKSPIKMEIEKVVDKWNLTLPSGNIMKGLNSLKDCSILIIEKYQKAQLQNRPFYLYDHNIRCEFRDYRIFTEYLVMEDGEIIDMTDKSEKEAEKRRNQMIEQSRKSRARKTKRVQTNVKKIDARIFDRNY